MKWRNVGFMEALALARASDSIEAYEGPEWPPEARSGGVGGARLSDGSVLVCSSDWCGPYSSVTPDIDAVPPEWWVGRT